MLRGVWLSPYCYIATVAKKLRLTFSYWLWDIPLFDNRKKKNKLKQDYDDLQIEQLLPIVNNKVESLINKIYWKPAQTSHIQKSPQLKWYRISFLWIGRTTPDGFQYTWQTCSFSKRPLQESMTSLSRVIMQSVDLHSLSIKFGQIWHMSKALIAILRLKGE